MDSNTLGNPIPVTRCKVTVVSKVQDHIMLQPRSGRCTGCRQTCSARLFAADTGPVSVRFDHLAGRVESVRAGDDIEIAMATTRLMSMSSLVYLAPPVLMLLSMGLAYLLISQSDSVIAVAAFSGLISGLVVSCCSVRWYERIHAAGLLTIHKCAGKTY